MQPRNEAMRYEIGREMAKALEAEQRRLDAGTSGPSPLPSESYDAERGDFQLLRPRPVSLDGELSQCVQRLARESANTRALARNAISTSEFYTLLTFARRAATLALRDRDCGPLQDGLAAMGLIEAERVDARDILVALSFLQHTADRLGCDAPGMFENAAASCEPTVREIVSAFAARAPRDKHLRDAFGYAEVSTESGPGFVRWGFREYRPSYDLIDVMTGIGQVLQSDSYRPDEIEIATRFPTVWLRSASDRSDAPGLEGVRAVASIFGRLRPSVHAEAHSQQLTVFLLEMARAEQAREVRQRVEAVENPSFALLAVQAARLTCVVVARSFVAGVASFETPDSLRRFAPDLGDVLQYSLRGESRRPK